MIAIFQQPKNGLVNTYVGFHSGHDNLGTPCLFHGLKKVRFTTAAKADFLNDLVAAGLSQFGNSMSDAFRVLLGCDDRHTQKLGRINQHTDSVEQLPVDLLWHCRNQSFLDINNNQYGLICIKLEFLNIYGHIIS